MENLLPVFSFFQEKDLFIYF